MSEKPISVSDRIEPDDLVKIAQQITDDYDSRIENRKDLVKVWDEVDRQLRMEPELSHKRTADNKIDKDRAWLPEVELPLQAQTLEMLSADNRRLKFPKNRDWFTARAALTPEYVDRFGQAETPIPGERGESRFSVTLAQDNADKLVQGVLSHFHNQYDFRSHVDKIDSQAYSYGFGVGRIRDVKKRILGHTGRGKNQTIPMLIPRNARNVYLDDSMHAIMHEGEIIGPNIIQDRTIKLADLRAAAENDESYISDEINRLTADDDGNVILIEMEGDLLYETSADTIVVRDVILTAAKGTNVSLIREQKGPGFSTYLIHDYHIESPSMRYGTSPLIKGYPIARIAAQVMNQLIASGMLKIGAPTGYDKDDPGFAGTGGPNLHPFALWPGTGEIKVYSEVGGDPAVFLAVFSSMVNMYYDVAGVNPPRLGAQTKSHTTAFAKDVEISQGSVRTVDYTNSTLEGPMTRFLELEYRMGLKNWRKQIVFIESWNEFVELERAHLPDVVMLKAIGAGAPAEDEARSQKQLAAVQLALQVDNVGVGLGREPKLDHGSIVDKILRDGGFPDISEVTAEVEETVAGNGSGALPGIISEGPLQ